jgi:hypothetical protein
MEVGVDDVGIAESLRVLVGVAVGMIVGAAEGIIIGLNVLNVGVAVGA